MSNRLGKLLSAILVSSLAGGLLMLALQDTAQADDTCLSGPKGATPAGSHWYFHVERGTKRHCWYLGGARGKAAQAATAKPAQPAAVPATTTQKTSAALQPDVADARAEFNGAPNGSDQATTDASTPVADTTSTNAIQNPPPPVTSDTSSTVTARWPDPSTGAPQTQPTPAPVFKPQPASQLLGERTEPGPVVPRVASMPSLENPTYSMPMLLGGLAGAVALAGILGFAAVKFRSLGRPHRSRRRQGSIWDVADTDQIPPWKSRDAEPAVLPHGGYPVRTRQEIEMQSRDILEILSRASRNAAT